MKKYTGIIAALGIIAAATGCTQNVPAQTENTTAQAVIEETTKAETEAVEETATEAAETSETAAETTETEETSETTAQTEKAAEEFDLESLSWDTDLSKYTNVVAYKISDGDISVDLDGDGVDEVLNFTHNNESDEAKEYTDYEYSGLLPVIPYLNGEPAAILTESNGDFDIFGEYSFSMPSGYVYVCDIMEGDGFKELAFCPFTYTDDYETVFVRYNGEKLTYLGSIGYDTPDAEHEEYEKSYGIGDMNITWGRPMVIDGSGYITAATRLSYQTWFGYTRYCISEEGVIDELANIEVYPYGKENKDSYDAVWNKIKSNWGGADGWDDCMLQKDITVYKTPSEDAESFVMTAQPAVPTAEMRVCDSHFIPPTDYENWEEDYKTLWVYVTAKDGTSGWMHAYPYEDTSNLFSVMTMYD